MKKVLVYSLQDKAYLINSGFYAAYKQARLDDFKGESCLIDDFHRRCESDFVFYLNFKCCKAIENSVKRKRKRVRDKEEELNFLSGGKIAFVTFTFSNDTLNKTSCDTRRQKVRRTLKKLSDVYIANIDFGKEHDREHYHALMSFDAFEDIKALKEALKALWGEYGFICVERVGNSETDKVRTKNYLVKLGFHAMKDTTKNHRLIYSRKVAH